MPTSVEKSPTQYTTDELAQVLSQQPGSVTADVRKSARGLESAILRTQVRMPRTSRADIQNDLHTLVIPHAGDIGRQIASTEELSEKVAATQADLDEVENEFDPNQPKVREQGFA